MKINKDKKIINKRGFVVLFAVVLASIVLSVSLGVANIAYKELVFTTSAKNSNEAFYAADTGAECALYYDQNTTANATGSVFAFGQAVDSVMTECAGTAVNLNAGTGTKGDPWMFYLFPLGSSGRGCAKVSLWKDDSVSPTVTIIDSKGYNIYDKASSVCAFSGANRVERHIQLTY